MSVSEEVPVQWHPYFEARGFESFHDVAKGSKVAVSTVIACLRPGGREPKDATVVKVATALGIPVSKLRELRGEPDVEPFTLPSKADQLDPVERRAVLTVVDALLRARGDDNANTPDSDQTAEPDAPHEASEGQEAKRYIVYRNSSTDPDLVKQSETLEAIDDDDARGQIHRALKLSGLEVDPRSDHTITVTQRGDDFTLIGLVREDISHDREEWFLAKLRERGAQLEQSDKSGQDRRLPRVTNSQSDRDRPGTDAPAGSSETGSNTTGSGDQVPSDAAAAGMTDVELQRAAQADPLWADYVKTKRPELILDF